MASTPAQQWHNACFVRLIRSDSYCFVFALPRELTQIQSGTSLLIIRSSLLQYIFKANMSTSRINKFSLLPFFRTLQCFEVCHFSFLVRTVVKWWQQHHRSGPGELYPIHGKVFQQISQNESMMGPEFRHKRLFGWGSIFSRPQPSARLPDVGGPKWFELQKTR